MPKNVKKVRRLPRKAEIALISVGVLISIIGILLLSAWGYGETHGMTFHEVMVKCFDKEKDELSTEVKNLTKVKLGYESSIKDYNENIEAQKETIELLTVALKNNEEQIEKLKENETANRSQITTLESENASLKRVINSLTDSNTITATAVSMMTKQLGEINELLNYYIELNTKNMAEIKALKEKNANLEKQLNLYKKMVDSLIEEDMSVVTFMYNNTIYDVQIVRNGSYASVATPAENDYFVFKGWKIGGNLIDLSQTVITADTVIEAELEALIKINVTVNNQSTRTNVRTYYFDSFKSSGNWTYDPSKIVVTNGVCVASDGDKVIGYDNYFYYNGKRSGRIYVSTTDVATTAEGVVKTAGVSTYKYGYLALNIQNKDLRPTLSVKVNVNGVTYDMSEFLSSQSWNFELDYLFDVSSLIQEGVTDYNVSFIVADVEG